MKLILVGSDNIDGKENDLYAYAHEDGSTDYRESANSFDVADLKQLITTVFKDRSQTVTTVEAAKINELGTYYGKYWLKTAIVHVGNGAGDEIPIV